MIESIINLQSSIINEAATSLGHLLLAVLRYSAKK
jgi:hypothetical protein